VVPLRQGDALVLTPHRIGRLWHRIRDVSPVVANLLKSSEIIAEILSGQ